MALEMPGKLGGGLDNNTLQCAAVLLYVAAKTA
jgi:hypothetical protein